MTNMIQQASIYTDFEGLAELKHKTGKDDQAHNRQVAEQFEALFIQSMLKSMRAASSGDPLTGSDQMDLYQDMMDKQLSINMSQAGGIGIADLIERQLNLSGKNHNATSANPANVHNQSLDFANKLWSSSPLTPPVSLAPDSSESMNSHIEEKYPVWRSGNPQTYIDSIKPYVARAADRLNTDPNVLLAISALETGWGRHVMQTADGQSSNNLFGIKATNPSEERHVYALTTEYSKGNAYQTEQAFRTYSTPQDSINDFAEFLLSNPRYRKALGNSQNPEAFVREIQDAGYATDPQYANKVLAVMQTIDKLNSNSLKVADNTH